MGPKKEKSEALIGILSRIWDPGPAIHFDLAKQIL